MYHCGRYDGHIHVIVGFVMMLTLAVGNRH